MGYELQVHGYCRARAGTRNSAPDASFGFMFVDLTGFCYTFGSAGTSPYHRFSAFFCGYSRNAVIGSIRIARSVGTKQARNAATPSTRVTSPTVTGSLLDVPYKMLVRN